jgi:WS/DGAT/MGAT family acyltransferase
MKSHHALWDGRSALPRVFGSMDAEPGPVRRPFYAAEPAAPSAEPGEHTGPDLASGLRGALGQVMALRELVTKLSARIGADGRPQDGARGNAPFSGPHTLFNAPVVQERSFAMFSLPLDEMREVGRAFSGTLNDVMLALVDGGLQGYLRSRGETHREPLVAMCPVSLREPGDLEATTKVATLFVPMATPRGSAARRMHEIIQNTRAAKSELKSLSNEAAVDYGALVFSLWLGARLLGVHNVARPVINFVISNVGGDEGPRYLGESRLIGAYPISMLAEPTGLNITANSTDGRMDFGIVANLSAVPEADEIAVACRRAFDQLRNSARRQRRATVRTSASGKTKRARIRAHAASR